MGSKKLCRLTYNENRPYAFAVFWRVFEAIGRVCGEYFEVIIDMVVNRHLKSCKLLTGAVLSDTNHSPRMSSGRTRRQYIRMHAREQR